MDGSKDSKWTICESGRSWNPKVDGSKEKDWINESGRDIISRDKSRRSIGMKLDGLKESKWTVQRTKNERSKGMKLDGNYLKHLSFSLVGKQNITRSAPPLLNKKVPQAPRSNSSGSSPIRFNWQSTILLIWIELFESVGFWYEKFTCFFFLFSPPKTNNSPLSFAEQEYLALVSELMVNSRLLSTPP